MNTTTQQSAKEPDHGNTCPLTTKAMSQPQVVTHLLLAKSTNYVFTTKGKTSNSSKCITAVITNT